MPLSAHEPHELESCPLLHMYRTRMYVLVYLSLEYESYFVMKVPRDPKAC